MTYFKNISSLSELKEQYRALILTNHPDKGGNTERMQQINAEFEKRTIAMETIPKQPNIKRKSKRTTKANGFKYKYGHVVTRAGEILQFVFPHRLSLDFAEKYAYFHAGLKEPNDVVEVVFYNK